MMLLTSAVKLARACLRLFWAIKMGARLGNNPKLRSKGWVTVNCMLVESDGCECPYCWQEPDGCCRRVRERACRLQRDPRAPPPPAVAARVSAKRRSRAPSGGANGIARAKEPPRAKQKMPLKQK